MRNLLASAALLSMIGSAPGQSCENPSTQMEMNSCAYQAYESADRELNDVYKSLLDAYKKSEAVLALTKAQRAWIALRDAECELEGLATQGGSMQPMVINMCLERMTQERVAWIKKKMTYEEGDVSCVRVGE